MFTQLIESGSRPRRSLGQASLSLLFHVAMGVGAVEATRRVAVPNVGPRADTIPFVVPEAIKSRPRDPIELPSEPGPAMPAEAIVVPVPVGDPIGLPPIEPGSAIDPHRFVLAPTGSGCSGCVETPAAGGPAVFTEETVDQPVELVSEPAPVYPAILQSAGLPGRVAVEFVVDTLGRVEPGSIRVIEASHPAFEVSAKDAIAAARFRPARARGSLVRQLVRQGVSFRIQ
jgi:TonB family protein